MAAKTVVFESKYAGHALVRYPKVETPSPTGIGYQLKNKGKTYQFQPVPSPRAESGFVGVLTVKVGQDRMEDHSDFLREGEELGITRDAIEALMAGRAFGEDYYLQGHEPGTLYPRPVDWRQQVTVATANLADDVLAEMIAKEKATHGRVDLLAEAEQALTVVTEIIAAEQAKRAEAEAAKPVAKAKPKAPASA